MKVKSVVDVITNSSSEVFIAKTGNQELIKKFILNIEKRRRKFRRRNGMNTQRVK